MASAQSLVSQTEFQGGQHDQTRRIRIKLDLKLYLSKVKISDEFSATCYPLRLHRWMLSQPNYFMIGCKESGAEKNLTFFCEGIQKVSHKEAQFWPKKLSLGESL